MAGFGHSQVLQLYIIEQVLMALATMIIQLAVGVESKSPLTPRQRDLLPYLLLRIPLVDIARKLGIKETGVKFHVTNIYKRYGVKDRRGLIEKFTPLHPLGTPSFYLPPGSSKGGPLP